MSTPSFFPAFLKAAVIKRDPSGLDGSQDKYPFSIPALSRLESLEFDPKVTCFVGDNGSGKSTLIEAIAIAAGFNPEGGSIHFCFSTHSSHSELYRSIRLIRGYRRPKTGFFLRAESFFNVATQVEELGLKEYGWDSMHSKSHGESFISLATERFKGNGLYILDEPEAALSPSRQIAFLARMHDLLAKGSQFIIATHSPILMAYPNALIYRFSSEGIEPVDYESTEHYLVTRSFLENRERFLSRLLD